MSDFVSDISMSRILVSVCPHMSRIFVSVCPHMSRILVTVCPHMSRNLVSVCPHMSRFFVSVCPQMSRILVSVCYYVKVAKIGAYFTPSILRKPDRARGATEWPFSELEII